MDAVCELESDEVNVIVTVPEFEVLVYVKVRTLPDDPLEGDTDTVAIDELDEVVVTLVVPIPPFVVT